MYTLCTMEEKRMKKFITILTATLLVLSSIVFNACSQSNKTFCEIVSEIVGEQVLTPNDAPIYFTIGDDDSYCEIDTNPFDIDDYSSSLAIDYIAKMNKALGLPDYLYNDMLHTSYSQGKQEETFEKFKVKYYYHPDKGLNISYYRI